jgi:hypothetical protein
MSGIGRALHDLRGQLDAGVADVDARTNEQDSGPGHEFGNLGLTAAAEGTPQQGPEHTTSLAEVYARRVVIV